MEKEFLTNRDYELAILVQDACNLSGVAHSFSKVVTKIWNEADRLGKGTDWVNTHPIVILYANKISSLSGSENFPSFSKAYKLCEEKVNEAESHL